MATYWHQLRSSSQLRWVSPALIVDWAVVICLWWIARWVEQQFPYERDPARYLDDPALRWPVTKEHVPAHPNGALDLYTWYLPLAVVLVVGAGVKRSLHDVHHGALVFWSSRNLMLIVVECLKNRVCLAPPIGPIWTGEVRAGQD